MLASITFYPDSLLFFDQMILDHQCIHTGCIKEADGVFYRVDDRFSHDVEACVQDSMDRLLRAVADPIVGGMVSSEVCS